MSYIPTLSKEISLFVADLQQIKDNMPLTTAIYNTHGNETMGFLMTGDMLELYKRHSKSGILINYCSNKTFESKYGMSMLYISGIDQEIGNILTFGIGLFTQTTSHAMWWCL